MNTIPSIISCKDLSYIEDIFNWNMNASKAACHFVGEIKDSDIKNVAKEAALMHARHAKK